MKFILPPLAMLLTGTMAKADVIRMPMPSTEQPTNQRESALTKVALVGVTFVLANVLALLSVLVHRTGPELEAYGNLCGPTSSDPCYQPALKGGFPIAYLYDAPGVSVEHQLSFGEDKLRPAALALDVAIYFAAILFVARIASRALRQLRRGHGL